MKKKISEKAYSALLICAAVISVLGVASAIRTTVNVSNSADGRRLPIYCVKTDQPKVALSFDAAWGDGFLMERGEFAEDPKPPISLPGWIEGMIQTMQPGSVK